MLYMLLTLLSMLWSATGYTSAPSGSPTSIGGPRGVNPGGVDSALVNPEARVSGSFLFLCDAVMEAQAERWFVSVTEEHAKTVNWKTCPAGEVLRAMTKSGWMALDGEPEGSYDWTLDNQRRLPFFRDGVHGWVATPSSGRLKRCSTETAGFATLLKLVEGEEYFFEGEFNMGKAKIPTQVLFVMKVVRQDQGRLFSPPHSSLYSGHLCLNGLLWICKPGEPRGGGGVRGSCQAEAAEGAWHLVPGGILGVEVFEDGGQDHPGERRHPGVDGHGPPILAPVAGDHHLDKGIWQSRGKGSESWRSGWRGRPSAGKAEGAPKGASKEGQKGEGGGAPLPRWEGHPPGTRGVEGQEQGHKRSSYGARRKRRRRTVRLICVGVLDPSDLNKAVLLHKCGAEWAPSRKEANREAHALNGNRRRSSIESAKLRQRIKNISSRITTINTAGFTPSRAWEAAEFMRNEGTHLLVLTETHTVKEEAREWKKWADSTNGRYGVVVSYYRLKKKNTGKLENRKKGVVAIWYKPKIDLAAGTKDKTGRWVELKRNKSYIWGVYAPATKAPTRIAGIDNEGYRDWWREKWAHVKGKKGIIVGDYNWAPSAKYTSSGKTNSLGAEWREFACEQGWTEKLDPENKWTFVSKNNAGQRSTLDRFTGSQTLMKGARVRVHKVKLTPNNDHWPVSCTWYPKKKKQQPWGGQGQFPDWILKLPEVIENLSAVIIPEDSCYNNMKYVNNRAKQIVIFQRKLYQEKRDFYKKMVTNAWEVYNRNPTKKNLEDLNRATSNLKEYVRARKAKETENRFREIFNEDERPTHRLTKSLLTRSKLIMNASKAEVQDFYKKLYAREPSKDITALDEYMPKPITAEQWNILNGEITYEEFESAFNRAKPGSAPGKDGWRALVWTSIPEMKELLWKQIQEWDNVGLQPEDKVGTICMLSKGKVEVDSPADVRPISLMDVKYKVYTDIFAERLQKVIPKYIKEDQRGFLRGRLIMENVLEFKIWQMHLTDEERIVLIDFAKAYDRVSHEYLVRVMEKMNMPRDFIARIRNIYEESFFTVLTDEGLTDKVEYGRGVKQGDPLSPILFDLALEPLLNCLRANIAGKVIGGVNKKVSGYADDVGINLKDEAEEKIAIQCIKKYEDASGAMLRPDKSWAIMAKGAKNTNFIRWDEGIKEHRELEYLGYKVNGEDMPERIAKMIRKLDKLKGKHMSLIGRVNTINSYGFSQLYYNMYANEINEGYIKEIKNITRWYLFSYDKKFNPEKSYMGKISHNRMIKMGLMDIRSQWAALQADITAKLIRNKKQSKIGQLLCNRLEEIREDKEWDVGAIHASSKIRWNKILNKGDATDFLIRNLNGINVYPGNNAVVGENVWVWSEHMVWWYDAKILKVQETEEGTIKKIITTSNDKRKNGKKAGEKLWVEDGWIVQGKDINVWHKKGLVIKPENIKIEHPKRGNKGEKMENTSKCKTIRKILSEREWNKEKTKRKADQTKYRRWKTENKNVANIRCQELTSNHIKAFAIKMETRAGMTRNQWHGEDVDTACPHCGKNEDEAHAFKNCPWTKQIIKLYRNIEKEWDTEIKQKHRLKGKLIGPRTVAWPMKSRQSQTLAWMIWKIRKVKEHGGGKCKNGRSGGRWRKKSMADATANKKT